MIVTLNWLKEFVDFDCAPEDLAHRLTMAGLEVEAIDYLGAGLDSVIVAKLISVEPHPEADRLTLCQVDTGQDQVPIVCGATNHKTGDLVALAQVGSVLPGDFKIKKSKIRGQVSMGMLCSEKELGLSEESAGIMILPQGLELGQPVFGALSMKDVRIEIGLTPNRPDCLSVVGVAREVAAMFGKDLKIPSPKVIEDGADITKDTSITIEEPDHCPRYVARVIKGVKIGPSPGWLVRRLESVGQRSVNNVVDVTNLVLMELGHPLHAFDFNLLRGRKIVVKKALEGSSFTTLDDQERQLNGSDLVICDGEGPVALAGIMGGQNSEINDDTSDVLLESAYFAPNTIRRTSKRLGIHSEASHRFERGADIDMAPVALERAAALIQEIAGGVVSKGIIDAYPVEIEKKVISLSRKKSSDILGVDLDLATLKKLLTSIGIQATSDEESAGESLQCVAPSFRPDLEREIDLVEEVARLNGYDAIPVTMPESRILCHRTQPHLALVNSLRNQMVAAGFSEVINYSFFAPEAFDKICLAADDSRRQPISILNPLTEEQSIMRTTLVPSMLDVVARNFAYRSLDQRLFELRPVFTGAPADEGSEPYRLTAIMTGQRDPLGWASDSGNVDFYDLKGATEQLLERVGVDRVAWQGETDEPFFHPGKSAQIYSGEVLLGTLGELHPQTARNYDLEQSVYLLDLNVEAVLQLNRTETRFEQLSRFPDVFRDTAILVDETVSADEVMKVVDKASAKFVEDVTLFDLYTGKGVPEGKKSLAFRVRYRSAEKTFTDEEINKAHAKIVRLLEREIGAEVR